MNETAQRPLWQDGEIIDGRYEVIRLAGRGGMGRVYQVKHLQWGIDLAVKQPHPDALSRPGAREQFVEEAEAWIALGLHPNLCCCHYVRHIGGLPVVFAEYVPGGSLRSWISDGRLYGGPADEVLRRVLDVAVQFAWGLEHAHRRGLVHQDVKPDNVLLDTGNGDINVKVTDFGLARARAGISLTPLEPDTDAGEAASILVSRAGLTKEYASPEQMMGAALSRRTDVYSYAVSVLEMFTGKRLWQTGSRAGQALSTYVAEGTSRPEAPSMPAPLAKLLERCLRRDPTQRPGSIADIAAEISDIYQLAVRSAYPRTMPSAARFRADELNNRGLSLLDLGRRGEADDAFAAALAIDPQHLHAVYNTGLLRWRGGEHTDDDLIAALGAAVSSGGDPGEARRLLAEVHRERGDHDEADKLLGRESAVQSPPSQCTRPIPWYKPVGYDLLPSGELAPRALGTWGVRFTRDGTRAVTSFEYMVRVWNTRDGQCVRELANPSTDGNVDISDDGRYAITAWGDTVRLWDLAEGRLLREIKDRERWGGNLSAASICLSGDGRLAVVGSRNDIVSILDFASGRLRFTIGGQRGDAGAAISRDGRLLLTAEGGVDYTLRLWEVATGRCIRVIDRSVLDRRVLERYQGIYNLTLSDDGCLAALSCGEKMWVYDLRRERVLTLDGHTGSVRSISMSGEFLVSTGSDDTVRLWSLDDGRCLRTFREQDGPVALAYFDGDTGVVVSAWRANLIRWWTVPSRYTAPLQLSRPREYRELSRLDARVTDLMDRARLAADPRAALELLTEARTVPGYERDPRLLAAWRELDGSAVRVGLCAAWLSRVFEGPDRNDILGG